MPSRILQPGVPRTFSQYFEMPFTIENILAEFDCTIARQPLDLPQSNLSFNLEPLERELNRNRNRIELVNETARREALISPILSELAELTNQRINVEYSIAVNEHLRGTVDYYIPSGNLIIIEAKQADLVRGFTQLAVELVAIEHPDFVWYGHNWRRLAIWHLRSILAHRLSRPKTLPSARRINRTGENFSGDFAGLD